MTFCQSTACSLVVAAGMVAGVVNVAETGPIAVQVIAVDTHGNTRAYVAALEPVIRLLRDYAPGADVEILERTDNGNPTGAIYVMVRHPDIQHLEDANNRVQSSPDWAAAISSLEATGRTLNASEILLDRTPY